MKNLVTSDNQTWQPYHSGTALAVFPAELSSSVDLPLFADNLTQSDLEAVVESCIKRTKTTIGKDKAAE
ncbi:hypothetical protein E2C01_042247 [Portunus trituberculatus]|uniref:Uncharacterized protein n=1 Tax=Portunus trituberculatus TaxID=210409 RepID=A0A5B7FVZ0_PORTR|nr:hypothetical protein [Portunus trituberculatus]